MIFERKGVPDEFTKTTALRVSARIFLDTAVYRCRLGGAAGGARGFSLAEIGLAEGVFHLTSLLCEVPSGMAADLLGRRRTLIFGGVLGVFSALAMAFAPGLGLICTAMALKALGYNMLSGTAEA